MKKYMIVKCLSLLFYLFMPATLFAVSVTPNIEFDHPVVKAGQEMVVYVLVKFDVAILSGDIKKSRPNLNLSLVIDRSGSMADKGKLEYAKKAAGLLVDSLMATDRLSVVEYDDRITVLWPSSLVESPEFVKRQIDKLTPRGSTNLTGGMMRGVEETLKHKSDRYLNRVILLSDGLANRGITNRTQIVSLVTKVKHEGVRISSMGLGRYFDEDLMTAIAENSGGNYYFIENPSQMARIYREEMSILFTMVTKGVSFIFKKDEPVKDVQVFGYPAQIKESMISVSLEDFYSEEERTLLLRFTLAPQKPGKVIIGQLNMSYQDLVGEKPVEIIRELVVSATHEEGVVEKKENKKVVAESVLIQADQEHEEYVRLYEKGKKDEALNNIKQLTQVLEQKNVGLKDVRIAKKIEALQLEEKEIMRPQHDKASYLKSRKQAFYQSKKGKRGKYILQEGSKGYEVERLQQALKGKGLYQGPIDGQYTEEVTDAVKEFQQTENLTVDGIAGPATLMALGLY